MKGPAKKNRKVIQAPMTEVDGESKDRGLNDAAKFVENSFGLDHVEY